MIEFTLLDHLPLWAFFLASLGIALVAGECGYRLGRHRKGKSGAEKEEAVGSVVGATLGLLAFLLAFTFGLAASRYDTRREALQEEINEIGTTYLRAAFLLDADRDTIRKLLREYVDLRIEANKGNVPLAEAIRESEKRQKELWKKAVNVGRALGKPGLDSEKVDSEMVSLFVDSLNQTIVAHSKRVGAVARARVPAAIWASLLVIAMIAVFSMGYDVGIMGTPRPMVGLGMIFCFAVTMWLIADLDRPHEGLIRVNYQGMVDLRASMNDETH